jgi:hypothetical protein
MLLRDYFAAQVMTGLMSWMASPYPEKAAEMAYKYADAMLKERAK